MKKQEYKNTVASKKKIAQAYLSLLIESPNNISVTEIVKRAGIHRGTFYIHFENVKKVEEYIEYNLASNFKDLETDFRLIEIHKTPDLIIKKFNEIIEKDLDFYRLFITAAYRSNLMDMIKNSIITLISNNFKIMQYVTNYERFKVVIHYITGGIIHTYTDWFRGNISCSLNELCAYLTALIKTGLKEFILDED